MRPTPQNTNGPRSAAEAPNVAAGRASRLPRDAGYSRPFSLDADRPNFHAEEQPAIYDCRRMVQGFFSQSNVDVTMALPAREANVGRPEKVASHGRVDSSDAIVRIRDIVREFGHRLGLGHQATFNACGDTTDECANGTGHRDVPVMGVDYAGKSSVVTTFSATFTVRPTPLASAS